MGRESPSVEASADIMPALHVPFQKDPSACISMKSGRHQKAMSTKCGAEAKSTLWIIELLEKLLFSYDYDY